jgi:hydroxyacylglutathione hydrolase
MLLSFPDETIVYAGHDYVKESIVFAKSVDPDNRDLDAFLKKYDPDHVWSTLGEERKINPFLRFNEKPIISYLEKRGYPVGTEYERWESVMDLD